MQNITLDWLKQNNASSDLLNFIKYNKLENFPSNKLNEIKGDIGGFFEWIKSKFNSPKRYNIDSIYKIERDLNGNVTKEISLNNRIFQYYYDKKGNKTKKILPSGEVILYEYNESGNVIKEIRQNGTFIDFDVNGKKIKEVHPDGSTFQYFYDDHFNMTRLIYPEGDIYEWDYEYYGNGQLKAMYASDTKVIYIPKV